MHRSESFLTEKERRKVNQMNSKTGRKKQHLNTAMHTAAHPSQECRVCYIKIPATLPALKVLPVGQEPSTCPAPGHETAAVRKSVDVDIQQGTSGEQTSSPLPCSVSIQGQQRQKH